MANHDEFQASDIQKVRAVLQEALALSVEERIREVNDTEGLPAYEKSSRISSIQSKMSLWSPKRKRMGIGAVKDKDGIPDEF